MQTLAVTKHLIHGLSVRIAQVRQRFDCIVHINFFFVTLRPQWTLEDPIGYNHFSAFLSPSSSLLQPF